MTDSELYDLRRLIRRYGEERLPDFLREVRWLAGQPGAADRLRELAHSIHGGAGSHGFPRVSHLAGILERAPDRALPACAGRLCEALEAAIEDGSQLEVPVRDELPPVRAQVLAVEDDRSLGRLLRRGLRREGLEVTVAGDGEEGWDLARERAWDLFILDVHLPRLNGFRLLRRIRRARPQAPVVMLSALGREADVVRALDLGADDYVIKPFRPAELSARLERLLDRTPLPRPGSGPTFSGQISGVLLLELLQMLATTRRSGELRVAGDRCQGTVVFERGLVTAVEGRDEPTTAERLLSLLETQGGRFDFVDRAPGEGEVHGISVGPLLLEASRRRDRRRSLESAS